MKRSKHSLSHYKLLSCDMGQLIPIGLTEVLPGDTIQHATSALVRMSPMLAPVMHPVHARIHHWFVPNRLLWDKWEDFITGGPDGNDASVFPTISMPSGPGAAVSSLSDYLGIPTGVPSLEVSALPFRAYALIWNEFYRDQDLQTPIPVSTASGVDVTTNTTTRNVAWEKDYFTSARPWEQKGPSITVPIGDKALVMGIGARDNLTVNTINAVRDAKGALSASWTGFDSSTANIVLQSKTSGLISATNPPNVYADLTTATGVNINQLREAFALQRFEEARARYGSRYTEYLRYLGVRSSDARLQRPEYLGGGKQTIQFSEVLQTAEGSDPVGDMKGHGIGAMRSNRYRRFFEEHGLILSMISIRPKTIYMQGLKRHWNRRIKEDFWQRELQHIGQQEVLNKEVYAAHATPNGTFGYQDRYDEYRRSESSVSGEFRTSLLDFWHLARSFATAPALNASFVECLPTERIFAVNSQNTVYVMCNHNMQARRLVSAVGSSFIF